MSRSASIEIVSKLSGAFFDSERLCRDHRRKRGDVNSVRERPSNMQGKYHRWLIALCLSVGTHTQSSSTGEIRAEDSNDQKKVYDFMRRW
jgi:hypothetical protein